MEDSSVLPSLPGVRVLVIDGDRDYRETLQNFLGMHLAEVRTAGSLQAALQLVSSFDPEVVVCDYLLPSSGSGCRLIRQMRQGGRDTLAIAVTGYVGPKVKRQCLEAGFQEVLWKPVSPQDLIQRIASLTKGTGGRGRMEAAGARTGREAQT